MKKYEIKVEKTGEFIRHFDGDAYLDLCLSTWTRIKGQKVVAVEISKDLLNPAEFKECYELFHYLCKHAKEMRNPRLEAEIYVNFDSSNIAALRPHNLEALRSMTKCIVIGKNLYDLQGEHNDGRGISCVRQVAEELMRFDIKGAKAIAHNEWDKISNYPNVVEFLKNHDLAHPSWYVH